MLSNKTPFLLLVVFIVFSLNACKSNKSESIQQKEIKKYDNHAYVLNQAVKMLGDNVKFAYKGIFGKDSTFGIAAGTEIKNASEWGIRFYFLKLENGTLHREFKTRLLNGSFSGCLVQKIKFPSFKHELIYYNSQDYFLGNSGGEIYSYLINFDVDKTYYAHLIIGYNQPVELFLSSNIDVPEVKSFFIGNFKRDYPDLKLVSKDISLQN